MGCVCHSWWAHCSWRLCHPWLSCTDTTYLAAENGYATALPKPHNLYEAARAAMYNPRYRRYRWVASAAAAEAAGRAAWRAVKAFAGFLQAKSVPTDGPAILWALQCGCCSSKRSAAYCADTGGPLRAACVRTMATDLAASCPFWQWPCHSWEAVLFLWTCRKLGLSLTLYSLWSAKC